MTKNIGRDMGDSFAYTGVRGNHKKRNSRMKNYLIFLIFILFIKVSYGQKIDFRKLSEKEQKLINDLSFTIKDTSISFLLSPFIYNSIDTSQLEINDLTIKYGFNKIELCRHEKDTILLERNDYFKILKPDSLIHWRKIDSKSSFIDPVLENIEKHYGKLGLCSFNRIIFSKDGKYALVEYWMHCGLLCGYGETILMKKVNNKWIKLKTLTITES